MHIHLITVSSKQKNWEKLAFYDYKARLPSKWRFQIDEISTIRRKKNESTSNVVKEESKKILTKIKSNEGYSLARSADAIGVTLGVLIGTIGSYFDFTRIIYLIDIICMLYILNILLYKLNISRIKTVYKSKDDLEVKYKSIEKKSNKKWIINLPER